MTYGLFKEVMIMLYVTAPINVQEGLGDIWEQDKLNLPQSYLSHITIRI